MMTCPVCQQRTCAVMTNPQPGVERGDPAVCLGCGQIFAFGETLSLDLAQGADMQRWDARPQLASNIRSASVYGCAAAELRGVHDRWKRQHGRGIGPEGGPH